MIDVEKNSIHSAAAKRARRTADSMKHIAGPIPIDKEVHWCEHFVSSTTDMLALIDQNYVYLATNPAYLNAFSKTSNEVIGRTVANVFGEEFFRTIIKPRADACLTGQDIRYQDWFEFPSLGRKWYSRLSDSGVLGQFHTGIWNQNGCSGPG